MGRRAGTLGLGAVLLAGTACVSLARAPLAEGYAAVKVSQDTWVLPSPEQLPTVSMGYRSALAGLLWANLLVDYGRHLQERRRFEYAADYLHAVIELDPKFPQPYYFASTILTTHTVAPTREDYLAARRVLERGQAELPFDAELWLEAGQYMAYLVPPHLEDPAEAQEWRLAGARALDRACELIGASHVYKLPQKCITAASLYARAGEREASIHFLRRQLAISDDPEIRKIAEAYLRVQLSEQEAELARARQDQLHSMRVQDLPFVPKDRYLVLGPPFSPARCAGPQHSAQPDCESSWVRWADNHNDWEAVTAP